MNDKKKRIINIALAIMLMCSMTLLAACGSKISIPDEYNYDDFSEFIKLGNYKNIKYTPYSTEVTQADIDKYIQEQLQSASKETKKVTNGVAKSNSIANIDYVGSVNGKEFDGGAGKGYDLDLANSTFIDGFAEGIIGHKVGETFDVNVTFPKDYQSADLAGKAAVFKTTINYLTERVLPEYNLDYVKNNTEFNSIADYEDSIRKQLQAEKKEQAARSDKETLLKKISAKTKLKKYPEAELKSKTKSLGSEVSAKTMIKNELILHAIAKAEGMEFTDKDYQAYCEGLLKNAGITEKEFKSKYGMSFANYLKENNMFTSYLYEQVMEKVLGYSIAK